MVKRTTISKYDYINGLIRKIKELQSTGQTYDVYFDELTVLYSPLIHSTCRKIMLGLRKTNYSMQDVKVRVMEILFDAIVRYNDHFTDKSKHPKKGQKFDRVWFSSYLKAKLPWEIRRILIPARCERDDMHLTPRPADESLEANEDLQKTLLVEDKPIGISANFISLCRFAQKGLKDDLASDIMMLKFGYSYKDREMARLVGANKKRVKLAQGQLKHFWQLYPENL